MTVRLRIALTIFLTGLITAIGVITTVAVAFQRFEHESAYDRANAFLGRAVALHDDLLDLQARDPGGLLALLRNLLLYEPHTQLYLLDAQGEVLASTGRMTLAPGFRVNMAPVRMAATAAVDRKRLPYVMGDDPEYMSGDAVIAARALKRSVIHRPQEGAEGFIYLVCRPQALQSGRLELFRSTLAGPALASVVALIVLTTLLAAWIIATVTRPLRVLSDEVAQAARDGFEGAAQAQRDAEPVRGHDEFARLRSGFRALLSKLGAQWDQLRRLDHFRREGVSNLSHDLRSPLTATTACLETLDARWDGDRSRVQDRELIQVALRNTRNAAQLVRSLGDLAFLDEPTYRLQTTQLDLGEALDDITMRFAGRAAQLGVTLESVHDPAAAVPFAVVDVQLFERAVANLVDNALKFTPQGGWIRLGATVDGDEVCVTVADTGAGIAAAEQAHLFDRFYQARHHAGPAGGEGGRGLGLAIVKRIAELHGGRLQVRSALGQGTTVTLHLPLRA